MDRIAVFLNGERGIPVIAAMRDAGHGVGSVHMPPGGVLGSARVSAFEGLRVEEVADVNDPAFVEAFAALEPSLAVIAGYSTIFRTPVLAVPSGGAINLHAGALPECRGGSPLNWAILHGATVATCSVLRVKEGIDDGNVLAEGTVPIELDDTIAEVHAKANALFPDLVLRVLDRIADGTLEERIQDESRAAYWHQRNDDDGRIDWRRMSAAEVRNLVRAVSEPYPGAFAYWRDDKVRIFRAHLPEMTIRGVPGRVCYMLGIGPYVVCADRAILVDEYRIEGHEGVRIPHGVHLS